MADAGDPARVAAWSAWSAARAGADAGVDFRAAARTAIAAARVGSDMRIKTEQELLDLILELCAYTEIKERPTADEIVRATEEAFAGV